MSGNTSSHFFFNLPNHLQMSTALPSDPENVVHLPSPFITINEDRSFNAFRIPYYRSLTSTHSINLVICFMCNDNSFHERIATFQKCLRIVGSIETNAKSIGAFGYEILVYFAICCAASRTRWTHLRNSISGCCSAIQIKPIDQHLFLLKEKVPQTGLDFHSSFCRCLLASLSFNQRPDTAGPLGGSMEHDCWRIGKVIRAIRMGGQRYLRQSRRNRAFHC